MKRNQYYTIPDWLMQVIEGHLLGDGSLSTSGSSSITFVFNQSGPRQPAVTKLSKLFRLCNIPICIYTIPSCIRKSQGVVIRQAKQTYLRVGANGTFKDLHRKWYRRNAKKPPRNLNLTWSMLAVWYEDDGCLNVQKRKTPCYYGSLSSQSFSKDANKRLVQKINELAGGKAASVKPCNGGSGWRIYLHANSHFWYGVAPYIQPCFLYKLPPKVKAYWKYLFSNPKKKILDFSSKS